MQSEPMYPETTPFTPVIDDEQWKVLVLDEMDRQSSEMDSYIARFQEQLNLHEGSMMKEEEEEQETNITQAEYTLSVRRTVRMNIEEILRGYTKQLSPTQAQLMDWARRAYEFEVRPISADAQPPPACMFTGETTNIFSLVFRAQVADTHAREISDVYYVSFYAHQVVNAWSIIARFEAFLHRLVFERNEAASNPEKLKQATNKLGLLRMNVNEGAFFLQVFFAKQKEKQHACYIAI
jgi:hypothetical protein